MQDVQEPQMAKLIIKLNLLTIEDTQIIEHDKQLYSNFVQTFTSANYQDDVNWHHVNLKVCAYSLTSMLITTILKIYN